MLDHIALNLNLGEHSRKKKLAATCSVSHLQDFPSEILSKNFLLYNVNPELCGGLYQI